MGLRERFSDFGDRMRHKWMYRRSSLPGLKTPKPDWQKMKTSGWLRKSLAIFAVLLVLYYIGGAFLIHDIEDDVDFRPPAEDMTDGGSKAVAMMAALIQREVNDKRWTANDPFFIPSALLDNMPNYQTGVMSALARFSFELTDQLGRLRGSSQADADLSKVSGLLQYPAETWIWDPAVSLWPRASAESQYRDARRALLSYNRRLAAGEAVFDRRSDNLLSTLDRIASDIGSSSSALDTAVDDPALFIDFGADDTFYNVKGQLYAYYLILSALREDFAPVIEERGLDQPWAEMLTSFRKAALLDPWVVTNGAPDGVIVPNHLAAQGFYLLRARTQLREITNILLK
jgi:hypothetical protein